MVNRLWFLKRNLFTVPRRSYFSIKRNNLTLCVPEFLHSKVFIKPFRKSARKFRALHRGRGSQKLNALDLRNYSSIKALNPNWVTGFTDGEGCFRVSVRKNPKYKVEWRVELDFEIGLNKKDIALLEQIKNLLKVGSLYF